MHSLLKKHDHIVSVGKTLAPRSPITPLGSQCLRTTVSHLVKKSNIFFSHYFSYFHILAIFFVLGHVVVIADIAVTWVSGLGGFNVFLYLQRG